MTRVRKRPPETPPKAASASAPAVTEVSAEPAANRYAVAAALAAGTVFWGLAGNDMPPLRWAVILTAMGVALLPPVSRALAGLLDRIRRPAQRSIEWATVLVWLGATTYLVATAFWQQRGLFPRTHDEASYVIAARMMAHGRLWMPAHPAADFFESIYVLVKPVYCSIYFPGAALVFAPMEWLGWASWMIPVVLSGAAVALLYRLTVELLDGAAAVLAVAWVLALGWFRTLSMMSMSHVPMLLLGLLVVWAWLRWRGTRGWGWALAIGAFSGWAAVTRPADALAYAVPVGVAMAASLRGAPRRAWVRAGALLVAGAAPFLALQVVFNLGVTGHPLRSAYVTYLERDQPGSQFGIRRYDPAWRPESPLGQKHIHYDWCRPFLEQHQPHNFHRAWFKRQPIAPGLHRPANFKMLADTTLPARVLLLLLPAGVFVLRGRLWVAAGILGVFVVVYALNPFVLEHYPVVVAPAMAWIVLAAWRGIAAAAGRWGQATGAVLAVLVVAASVTSLPEVNRFMATPGKPGDGMLEGTELSVIREALNVAIEQPAVVLFGPRPAAARFKEPVYNTDTAWPDDAAVVRARDLGSARNPEIVAYYADRQPERTFYHYDWNSGALRKLGRADQLHRMLRQGMTWDAVTNPAGTGATPQP